MDWIKKNYEKFSLLLLSVGLLGVSVFLVISAQGFLKSFDGLKAKPVRKAQSPSARHHIAGSSPGVAGQAGHMGV